MIPVIALVGLLVSSFIIYIGFLAEPAKDRNRLLYLFGTLQVEALAKAVERYKTDCGDYPPASEGLQALRLNPGAEGWNGPYLQKDVPLDPWGRPYLYLRYSSSTKPEILSHGADGKPGGTFFDADISTRNLHRSIPYTPSEVRARGLFAACWIAAWCCLIGSILTLLRSSRQPAVKC
jgi:general secretion pathway protein G